MAHRIAYALEHGQDALIAGRHICHSCDNPPCVRPDHLFQGEAVDNVEDSIRKGRRRGPDPANPSNDLKQTLKILGLTQREFARKLGVDHMTVNRWITEKLPVPRYAAAYLELMESQRKQDKG